MSIRIQRYVSEKGREGFEVDLIARGPDGVKVRERRVFFGLTEKKVKERAEARHSHLVRFGRQEAVEQVLAPTLAEFETRFMEEHAIANREKASSIQAKRSHLKNHLIPELGPLRLDRIGPSEVAKLKARLSAVDPKTKLPRRGPKTINNIVTTLNTMLGRAKEWGVIAEAPKVKLLKWAPPEMEFYPAATTRSWRTSTS
jgi:hypothetical protein